MKKGENKSMKKRMICTVLAGMLAISLSACSGNKKEAGEESAAPTSTGAVTENTSTVVVSTAPVAESPTPDMESVVPEETKAPEAEKKGKTVTLQIGMEGMVKEYKYNISGKLTAEKLIAGIADMTGWNLDLADKVTSGKGGMTVCFANTSSIFTGPPEPQKEEFMVYDKEELVMTILESVKQTLQNNFVDEKSGDPSSLNIYFCGEGDTRLEFNDISKYVPLDKPYTELKSRDTTPSGTIKGKFMGFSDTSTIEVKIGKKSVSYQVLDEKIIDTLSNLEEGTVFTFKAEKEDGISTVTKVFK